MRLAVDLHLHSRFAKAVSPAMTLPNLIRVAQLKGIDLLSTGDCLQATWLEEIQEHLVPAEPGLWKPKKNVMEEAAAELPVTVQRDVRFVLGTEVCCAPEGARGPGGLHHLLYFPSLDSVLRLRDRLATFGNLNDGRPALAMSSRQLLELVIEADDGSQLAPAHVFNPWFSLLGTVSGGRTPEDSFQELTPRVLAMETGLTSTAPMCRRVSALDGFNLFSCSDAHSLDHLGREYTLMEIDSSYDDLMAALRGGTEAKITGAIKFPLERTRYYRNRCTYCKRSFEGEVCLVCHRPLVTGSHDRLEAIATRSEAPAAIAIPPFRQLLPLSYVIAELLQVTREHRGVGEMQRRLTTALGTERFILTEATADQITPIGTAQLARAIVLQRSVTPGFGAQLTEAPFDDQLSLGLG